MSEGRATLSRALVAFFGAARGAAIDPLRVDPYTPLFESGGLVLAGEPLDSLAIAETLVALEVELEVDILGRARAHELSSIQAIATFVAGSASPEAVGRFERRWCDASRSA